ncbi:hypothetical protein PPACK8108_LOCUS5092 [Phakopsora pachyrhizi]|uniref:Uncharacterized protein n=1 Tax=Phakopsora pachyrhizi TaxID=170000 RepID=A0AAV0APK3_PHAPC|nr:hypothetical protein PPACK8108_LOCUS5092 [Phakopsora pachyrhizi]
MSYGHMAVEKAVEVEGRIQMDDGRAQMVVVVGMAGHNLAEISLNLRSLGDVQMAVEVEGVRKVVGGDEVFQNVVGEEEVVQKAVEGEEVVQNVVVVGEGDEEFSALLAQVQQLQVQNSNKTQSNTRPRESYAKNKTSTVTPNKKDNRAEKDGKFKGLKKTPRRAVSETLSASSSSPKRNPNQLIMSDTPEGFKPTKEEGWLRDYQLKGTFRQIAAAGAYEYMNIDPRFINNILLLVGSYNHYVHWIMAQRFQKESKESGKHQKDEEKKVILRARQREMEKSDAINGKRSQRQKRVLPKTSRDSICVRVPKGLPIDFYNAEWFNDCSPAQKTVIADTYSVAFLPDATKSIREKQHPDEKLSDKRFSDKYWDQATVAYDLSHEIAKEDDDDNSDDSFADNKSINLVKSSDEEEDNDYEEEEEEEEEDNDYCNQETSYRRNVDDTEMSHADDPACYKVDVNEWSNW